MFSTKLKEVMDKKGVSRKQLAKSIGKTEATVGTWLRDESYPEGPTLSKIAKFLNTTMEHLIDDDLEANKFYAGYYLRIFDSEAKYELLQYIKKDIVSEDEAKSILKIINAINEIK